MFCVILLCFIPILYIVSNDKNKAVQSINHYCSSFNQSIPKDNDFSESSFNNDYEKCGSSDVILDDAISLCYFDIGGMSTNIREFDA